MPNTPDLARFDPARFPQRARSWPTASLRLVYAGALTPTYELDVVLDALTELRASAPELPVRLDLYGRGDSAPALAGPGRRAALGDARDGVRFHGRIPIEDVPAALAAADIGLAPDPARPSSPTTASRRRSSSTRAMGKPVVASRLPLVERTFGDAGRDVRAGFRGRPRRGDPRARRRSPSGRARRTADAADRVRELAWDREGARYVALIESLVSSAR